MKGKKGTHVEVVLSFVLFVGAIFFIFLAFEKDIFVRQTPSSFISFKENLKKEISENLTSITINVPTQSSQSCIILSNFISSFNNLGNKIIARDSSQKIDVDVQGNNLVLNSNGGRNFFIYSSPAFEEESSSLTNCEEASYSIAQVKKQKFYFESKILNLSSEHENSYEQLKEKLKIPKNQNFGFSFVYSNNTVVSTKENLLEVNVYAEEEPLIFITKDGEVQIGKLIFRMW
ncbi:MAG: hypothetical protein KatS3mg001_514 [Candidatus Pacearchaeota archaeon]|nr:MAG: hypothetical protein KatS3mg001_514 [Candidatus Pacearchaeota archaeon]